MQSAQVAAVLKGADFPFEAELAAAASRRENAKYAILVHQQEHGCGESLLRRDGADKNAQQPASLGKAGRKPISLARPARAWARPCLLMRP